MAALAADWPFGSFQINGLCLLSDLKGCVFELSQAFTLMIYFPEFDGCNGPYASAIWGPP